MSHLRIFPQVATVYPNDRQTFTAQAVPPPAMWRNVSDGGDIKSDFSLEVDAAGSQTSGNGAHQLYSGLGIVELTVDDQCLPTSTGFTQISGIISDITLFTYNYSLRINATTVKVFDEGSNEIYTESYSTVSGDVYRLELSAGFRFYRKSAGGDFILKHSRVDLATAVAYPMSWSAFILEPTVTAPTRIPAPRLIGDWRLGPFVTWTAPSQGNLTTTGPGTQTELSGIVTAGKYTLTVAIEAAADAGGVQSATATIELPPFQVLGPTEVTARPGQKLRFKTNYDAQQLGNLVTWSVLSGAGGFTQGEFTAPSTAGLTIVRATANLEGFGIDNQVADIKITVPALITNASGFTAAKPSEQIDFDINAILLPQFISVGPGFAGIGDLSLALPPDLQINDIMLMLVENANDQAVATPTDWAIVADSPQGTGAGGADSTRLSVFWRRATATELAFTTVTDPGDHGIGFIIAFRGCIGSGDPWDVTSGDVEASAVTGVSIPGDTTTVVNCLIVLVVANATDTSALQTSGYTNADLANLTERLDANTDAGNGGGLAVVTGEKAAIGAYGATTATLATASVQGRMSIALKPALFTWSASAGSINSSTGAWTAPSLAGQTAKITVTNGTLTVTLEVPVLEAFPFSDFSLPVTWDRKLTALISSSEDRRSRVTRDKSPSHDSYEVKLTSRSLTESNTVDAFFDAHGFGKLFILEDAVRGIRKVGWFDSEIRHEGRDECDIDLSFRFLEARLD